MLEADNRRLYWLLAFTAALYIYIGYFLQRHQSFQLMTAYLLLFSAYGYIILQQFRVYEVTYLLIAGMAFRIVLLFTFPNLSDDIYRFVWDGRLLNAGIHPFAQLPDFYLDKDIQGINQELYNQLNSPHYFTVYPPFAQFVFWISTVFTNSIATSVLIVRSLIVATEAGSLLIMLKLLDHFKLPKSRSIIYALNPLVILELTGNLHFEAFMIFFILLFVYFLVINEWVKSAFFLSLGIATKLIPLLFIPMLIKRMSIKNLLLFGGMTVLFTSLIFLPLLSYEMLEGMRSSVGLYFQKFEFNASVYYIVREIGFWVKGYNIIGTAGTYLALATFGIIVVMSFAQDTKQIIIKSMMWVLFIYLLMATTVHPWYICTLLMLSVFTNYRFAVLWSLLIFWSYIGYSKSGFSEYLWVTFVEYLLVLSLAGYEIYKQFITKEYENLEV